MKNIREIIGENLSTLRKERKLTQLEIAEKFNYSDKAVSKWEKGDTLPDVETLSALADFYGVTLDYITHEGTKEEKAEYLKKESKLTSNQIATCALVSSIVWILATIIFVYATINPELEGTRFWVAFIWAIPLTSIICMLFNKKHFKHRLLTLILVSLLFWSIITATYLTLGVCGDWNLWPIFILGIPLQVSTVLWYSTKR